MTVTSEPYTRGALQPAWSPMTKDARDHHVTKPRFDRGVDDQQISPMQAKAMGFVAAQAHLSDVVRVWLQQLVEVSRQTVILYSPLSALVGDSVADEHGAVARFFERTTLQTLEIALITGDTELKTLRRHANLRPAILASKLDGK